jgi:cell division septation protein DedD
MLLDAKEIEIAESARKERKASRNSGAGAGMIAVFLCALLLVAASSFGFGYLVGHSRALSEKAAQADKPQTPELAAREALPQMATAAAAPAIPAMPAAPPSIPVSTPQTAPLPAKQTRAVSAAMKPLQNKTAVSAPGKSRAALRHQSPAFKSAASTAHNAVSTRRANPFHHIVSNPNYGLDAASGHQPIIQVAVLYTQADANTLLDALGKHGFNATSSRGSDNRIHVHLGPFATYNDAAAMREKLLNSGYNAVIQ